MIRSLWAALSVAALAGCAGMLSAPEPMRYVDYPAAAGPAKCLFVLLPGRGDHAETFEKQGFIDVLRRRALSIDIRAADATLGYFAKGTYTTRLQADVVAPARARGYQEVWLAGPSMGGFGSLFYSRAHPGEIDAVLALAPYLGDDELIAEIAKAGGLKQWSAPPRVEPMDRTNYQRELWRWLQATTQGREAGPRMYAGYGTEDSLSTADALLTAELPAARVFLAPGGHDWPVWNVLLGHFLDSPEFAGHCR